MFSATVRCPDGFSESLFNHVYKKTSLLVDESLVVTTTLLLYQRVENLKISYDYLSLEEVDKINTDPNVFSFYWLLNPGCDPDEVLDPVKTKFKSIKKLSAHEKFLSEKLKRPFFIRLMPNENNVCVFATLTPEAWHGFQFFISKYFDIFKEKPLTANEISFMETLTHTGSVRYISKAIELINTDTFRRYQLANQLQAFEKKMFEQKVESAKTTLKELETVMETAMQKYREACSKHIEALALVSGLKSMADQVDEHTELQDYLLKNKILSNVTISGTGISYIVKTYLAPHHADEWEILNKRPEYFKAFTCNKFKNTDDIKLLLDAIFSENHCLRLRVCAYIILDYFGTYANSKIDYNFALYDADCLNYIPNTHLNKFNCFGQNLEVILEQLKQGDTIGAIECSIACVQRINIHESMTFLPFVRNILASGGKCLVAEDGTEMTPEEAVTYLKGLKHE